MNPKTLVQVSYNLAESRACEIRGLLSSVSAFGIIKGYVVTMDEEGVEEYEEGTIEIVRGWRFAFNTKSFILA